jgi:hypothetical protein
MGPDGYLVCLAFANPFYRDEALVREKLLGRAIFLWKSTGTLCLGELRCVDLVGTGYWGVRGEEVRCAAAWMLYNSKVTGRSCVSLSIAQEQECLCKGERDAYMDFLCG